MVMVNISYLLSVNNTEHCILEMSVKALKVVNKKHINTYLDTNTNTCFWLNTAHRKKLVFFVGLNKTRKSKIVKRKAKFLIA